MSAEPPPIDEASGVEERPQNRREWSGVLRSLALPLLIVAAIVGGLFYLQRERGGSAPDAGYGIVEPPPGAGTRGGAASTDVGRTAPDFLLPTPDGGALRLSDLRGKPVLVNFWASWCTPCRQEMPVIVRAWDAGGGAFEVIAIDLQENVEQVRAFTREFGMRFPVAVDRTGSVAATWRIDGPVTGIPSSYFLDADGVVRARESGPMDAQTLARDLAEAGAPP